MSALIDDKSRVELGDGWAVGAAIGSDGSRNYWLLAPGDHEGVWVEPDHERVDRPLPTEIQTAIDCYGKPRCGATKRDGQPCRALVHKAGDRCRHHADAQQRLF